ncbi:MAG: molybdopterin molybdotransferase MoeA, partial [Gammaproteobacteria bacterium]
VRSPIDVPGHTNSAVDGYAVDGASLPLDEPVAFEVVGTAWAGAPFTHPVVHGAAARIMTGAAIPEGTDSVVMLEHVELTGETVTIGTGHRRGQNVRHAGEDMRAGQVVLDAGKRLGPAEVGMLASLGFAEVPVRRRLRVAVLSTGDELRAAGEPLEAGAIYDSNRYTIGAMLQRLGAEIVDLGVARDDIAEVRSSLALGAEQADAVISSGGASAGEADYIRQVLGELGQVGFWRIAIRPGRPLAYGKLGNAFFFGLPGNPVAVMVTFYQFVQPALRLLAGEAEAFPVPTLEAKCVDALRKKPGRIEYYRAILSREDDGELVVRHTGKTGSGLLHTMSDANCFIVLPEHGENTEPGAIVQVQPFFGLV